MVEIAELFLEFLSIKMEGEILTFILLWQVDNVGMQFMFNNYVTNHKLRFSKYKELTQSPRWIEYCFSREESHSSLYMVKWTEYGRQDFSLPGYNLAARFCWNKYQKGGVCILARKNIICWTTDLKYHAGRKCMTYVHDKFRQQTKLLK
jgi:hypothetical protein